LLSCVGAEHWRRRGERTPFSSEHDMLITIVVGIIAGFLAGKIMKGSGYGVLIDLLLGLVGGMLGGWLFGLLGIGGGGVLWAIVVATVGAVILVWLTRVIQGRSA
jgi:uncharacterized membrane protein YeaQ/YmgE (transglycosylase-associated protein family)